MALLPDLAQLLPLQGGALFEKDRVAVLSAYATASPGPEPALSLLIAVLTHHLHCVMHRAVIAAAITLRVWTPSLRLTRSRDHRA